MQGAGSGWEFIPNSFRDYNLFPYAQMPMLKKDFRFHPSREGRVQKDDEVLPKEVEKKDNKV